MHNIRRVFAFTLVFALASAALVRIGTAETKESLPYNGITFFGMSQEPAGGGHEGRAVPDTGSKTQLFNGITFIDQTPERTPRPDARVQLGELPDNGITVFR